MAKSKEKKNNASQLVSSTLNFLVYLCIYFLLGAKLVYMKETIQHIDEAYDISKALSTINENGNIFNDVSYVNMFNNSILIFKGSSTNITGVNLRGPKGIPVSAEISLMDFIKLTQLTYLKLLQYALINIDNPFLIMLLSPFIFFGVSLVFIVYYIYLLWTYWYHTYSSCTIYPLIFLVFVWFSPFIFLYIIFTSPAKEDLKPLDRDGNPFTSFGLTYIRDLMSRTYFKYFIILLLNYHIIQMCMTYTNTNVVIVVIISLLTFKYSFKIQEIYTKKAPIERDETMIRNFLNAVNGSNRMSLSNIANVAKNVANTLFTNVASKLTDGLNRITQSTPTTTTTPTKTKSTVTTTATPSSKKSTK